jgi:hypothetical protein
LMPSLRGSGVPLTLFSYAVTGAEATASSPAFVGETPTWTAARARAWRRHAVRPQAPTRACCR